MLIIGGMGGVNNWIIAPMRGLLYAIRDGEMSRHLLRENRFGAPSALLILQALLVTLVVALVFLWLPSINSSYWLLTALASQLYMLMYVLIFAAGVRLRYKHYEKQKGFLIPGGNFGVWVVAIAGLVGVITTFVIGFVPPNNIQLGSVVHYEALLITGLIVMSLPPFAVYFLLINEERKQPSLQ